MELTNLVEKLKQELNFEGKSIPELCRSLGETDQYTMMEAIAELEDSGFAVLKDFGRIYREDGGAIYLAKYARKAASS